MTISREGFLDRVLSLLWGVWTGVGTSGFSRENFQLDFVVDPEAFIIATAHFGEHDVRLRNEVIKWCASFFRAIPRGRLKNMLAKQPGPVRANFERFAATVSAHSEARWPSSSDPYEVEMRPMIHRDLRLPHLLELRMRGLFGTSARAEVITFYATNPWSWFSASQIAHRIHYGKRSVAEVLAFLAAGGLLDSKKVGNHLSFGLRDPQRLLDFVGEIPGNAPPWDQIFLILYEVETLLSAHAENSPAAEVDIVRTFSGLKGALAAAGLRDPLDLAERPGVWEPFISWVDELTDTLARGDVGRLPTSHSLASQPGNR